MDPERLVRAGNVEVPLDRAESAKQLFSDFDAYIRLRLASRSQLFDQSLKVMTEVTNVYEKMILLDGAVIGVSITYLTSLLSRLGTFHVSSTSSLWMVEVSWLLSIVSMYFNFRVIVKRHSEIHIMLVNLSSEQMNYFHGRMGVHMTTMAHLVKGTVSLGGEEVDIASLPGLISKEHELLAKQVEKAKNDLAITHKERPAAIIAFICTLLSIIFLCIFAIRSLKSFF